MKSEVVKSLNLVALIFFLAMCSVALCARIQDSMAQVLTRVSTSYSLPGRQLTRSEPVYLKFGIVNGSSNPVVVDLGQDRKGGYSFVLTRPDGVRLRLPSYSREGLSRIGTLVLQPGETYSEQLLLNEWYEFTAPGRYILEARLIEPIVAKDGKGVLTDPGFRGDLYIGPRDELVLAKTCDGLATQIGEAS